MKLRDYAKLNDVCYKTAYNHWKKGMIKGKQLATGTIVVFEDDVEDIESKDLQVATYARVSDNKSKGNLERQQERLISYANAKGYKTIKNVKEISSGLNDKRPKLIKLLEDETIDVIIVENKDRLTRFGFNYIDVLLKKQNRKIEVINLVEDDKQDLIQDFVSVITSFCARIYGQRRVKNKTEKILKEIIE